MSMVLTNTGKPRLLDKERTYLNTLQYRLFMNNYTPVSTSTSANFTEVTDSGYAAVSPVGFTAAYLNGSNQAEVDAPAYTETFTFSGGGFTVYGYYVTDPADGVTVYAERAASPFTVTAAGQTYTVVPKKVQDTM